MEAYMKLELDILLNKDGKDQLEFNSTLKILLLKPLQMDGLK